MDLFIIFFSIFSIFGFAVSGVAFHKVFFGTFDVDKGIEQRYQAALAEIQSEKTTIQPNTKRDQTVKNKDSLDKKSKNKSKSKEKKPKEQISSKISSKNAKNNNASSQSIWELLLP